LAVRPGPTQARSITWAARRPSWPQACQSVDHAFGGPSVERGRAACRIACFAAADPAEPAVIEQALHGIGRIADLRGVQGLETRGLLANACGHAPHLLTLEVRGIGHDLPPGIAPRVCPWMRRKTTTRRRISAPVDSRLGTITGYAAGGLGMESTPSCTALKAAGTDEQAGGTTWLSAPCTAIQSEVNRS
jgi:hypothetical protein